MPIYPYTCDACAKKFDLLVGMTQEKTDVQCPACNSRSITRGFGTFRIGAGAGCESGSSGCSNCASGNCSSCTSCSH